MKKTIQFLVFSLCTNILMAQQYTLVWSDEFNQPVLNSQNWTAEIGTGTNGWGNNELQYYTARPENLTIQNGNLLIIGKKEAYQGREYTSARIKTQAKQNWKYGRMEARIKLPLGQGLWPAFWMLGENITSVSWPNCGEIDIMEHVNSSQKIVGTMHWDANGHAYYGGDTLLNDVTQFHVYSVEWDSSSIKWFVDGKNYWNANILNNINSTHEFHNSFFILLNLAIGGNYPGNPTVNSVIADTLEIDYVRVYQKQNSITHISDVQNNSLLKIFPNPLSNTNILNMQFQEIGNFKITILDFLGRELITKEFSTSSANENYQIPIENFTKGQYIIQTKSKNGLIFSRLLVQ